MDLGNYMKYIGRSFVSRRAWHEYARQLEALKIVKRYDKLLDCGERVDGYHIIDHDFLELVVW